MHGNHHDEGERETRKSDFSKFGERARISVVDIKLPQPENSQQRRDQPRGGKTKKGQLD